MKKDVGEDPDPSPYLYVSLEQKRIDQNKPFDAKTAAWVPDTEEGYVQGKITGTKGDLVTVSLPSGDDKSFKKEQVSQVNPPKYEKCEDMSNLTYLNDASVLHNLKQRYYIKLIYTYSGLFCVAINPYKRFPIYTNRAIAIYKAKRRNEVPPHIFAISDGAYTDMMNNNENQSMLITGESGAGKTENTKKVIQYFARIAPSGIKQKFACGGNLEDQVVQTNPVLEAFGNAKTVRNDNSSRFGKFIRIHFGPAGKLAGADIETYLLEKARVISQQPLERSYHMFYQMMSGSVTGLKDMCSLNTSIRTFRFVSQGKTTIPGVDDGEMALECDEAFDILNFSKEDKMNIYKITATVMHLGEMKFRQKGREEQAEADGTEEGERVAKLVGVEGPALYMNLLKPKIKVGNEFVTQGRNKDQVYYSVGALAKAMYDRMFKWLVKKVNLTLDTKQKRAHFIGVLDIAGFEIFDYNGFEQLCINFTNEKLQQFFNHHMFVLEQEEYKKEGIDWVFVDFGMDLQACIELMEKFNGFEQLCINFTNEKLQQFFNHHMFVLEQEEYKREGIDWVFVDFGMDLQACIDLMEKLNNFEQMCINFTNEKLQQFFNHHMFVLEQEEYKREGIDWVFVDFGMDLQACIDLMEKLNNFEQLCINYTNEKLQQFFNHHMFILEQEEYKAEGLPWNFIDFGLDLQQCIDLIERPMGVLSILEEESMFPKATDKTFEEKLKNNHLGKSSCFIKPRPPKANQVESHFAIVHYAGTVAYNLIGWLEKNKDPLNDTVVDQFKKGQNALAREIFADHPGQSGDAATAKGAKRTKGSAFQTVSAMYREQLNNLMVTLRATQPHFIRCIIPNETKSPGVIDSHLVMHQLTCNGVLEGIRICRKGFPNRMVYADFKHRYRILDPKRITDDMDPRAATEIVMEGLPQFAELHKFGHTKVFFRAGVLGQMEELRDDRLSKIFSWIQAWVRGYFARKSYKKLQDQRIALQVVQRNLRKYMQLRNWMWFKLWQKIKPMLNVSRIEDEMKALEARADKALAASEKEEKLRKQLEDQNGKLSKETSELQRALDEEAGSLSDYQAKQAKLQAQKKQLEKQLQETSDRLAEEEEGRASLLQQKKKLEQELNNVKKDMEDLELTIQKAEQDKATKDHQIKNLQDEVAHQQELIAKLNKEKKHLAENQQKTGEDLQSQEDRVNHLNKVKAKLERSLDELEDSVEREKKLRADVEKNKRKVEGDLKLTQEAVADLERNKKELEQTIARKDKEIASLSAKLEDEQSLVNKLHKQIKELQARIEELEEELETERHARAKAEKQRSDLARELEELGERLDEAGGATAAQIELNKKREAELAKLRRDIEEQNIQNESALAGLRRRHNDAIAEMSEQIDQLNKMKAKAEKDRESSAAEVMDLRSGLDYATTEKAAAEKANRQLEQQSSEATGKLDDANRTLNEFDQAKKKLAMDNADMQRQLEETEQQISQLSKMKVSLTTQLEDTRKMADEESREKAGILSKYRNLEHEMDCLREQIEEEAEHKAELQRQLSKVNAEAQMWKQKYETDGIARVEELEEQRGKLSNRLQECEEQLESLNTKNSQLEKLKNRLSGELEDMHLEVDRAQQLALAMEKKARNFDKVVAEWKMKVEDLSLELDASQKECRNYSTELFRVKAAYEESQEQIDSVRRENKNLADEVKDLMDQIGEGGRNIHEAEKARKRLEVEKEELQSALEEAEAALEQEENKVIRGEMELQQVRQEMDRRLAEKEEEFDNTRKNHQRCLDSMQASLEAEAKGRAEAMRMKKKLEQDINELEIALDQANKANAEAQKTIRRYQAEIIETQARLEEEQRLRDDLREQLGTSERRANALGAELEESRTLLEQADRGRRQAELDLSDNQDALAEMQANYTACSITKRKLEGEVQSLHADLDDMLNEAKNSEEKAKKAMVDAARLSDELRAEQEHSQSQIKLCKSLEIQIRDLQARVEEAEVNAIKASRKIIAKLEDRVRAVENELDTEQRRHSDVQKGLRKTERQIKELSFQTEEDKKNQERMQDLVDSLQQKIKTYKRQIEEAEEIAALNLAKFRKSAAELEETEERCEMAEATLAKMRARGRGMSPMRGQSPMPM